MRINSIHDALFYFPDIDGYWYADNLPKTERELLGMEPKTVVLLTQLARAQALQGKMDEARTSLDSAHRMISQMNQPLDARTELRWLLEQGRVLCLSMSPSKAHDMFVQAWNMANETRELFFAIDAALMISTLKPPRFQNEWLKKALDIARSTNDEQVQKWLPQLLFLDGWHSYDFRQFDAALTSFDQALAQPTISDSDERSFPLLWSRARTMRALGRTAEALQLQQQLLTKMNGKGKVNGHVYLEIAECQQLLKSQEEAKVNFELAYAELSADGWYSDNKTDELERMKYLSKKR